MNEDITTTQPGVAATGDLSLAEITAAAGPEFVSWLCGLFGADAGADMAEPDAVS